MSPRRRLTGIAAMSAVTLATAGLAGAPVTAQDDDAAAELRAMLEAFGGGDVPDEVLTQILNQYEAMGIDPSMLFGGMDPEMLAAMAAMGGGDMDESAFIKMFMGGGDDAVFPKVELEDAAFPKVELEDAAFPKVEIEDEAFLKWDAEDQAFLKWDAEDEAFLKWDPIQDDGALAAVESALGEAAAEGDIDPVTLATILELLQER